MRYIPILRASVLALSFPLLSVASAHAQSVDLTGTWTAYTADHTQEGTYYVRQVGRDVFMYGEASPSASSPWCNVEFGSLAAGVISVDWADVPKGTYQFKYSGHLSIQVSSDGNSMSVTSSEGDPFGTKSWVRTK